MKKLLLVMALAALLCGVIYGIDYRPYAGTKTSNMKVKTDSTAAGYSVVYDTFAIGNSNDITSLVGWIRVASSSFTSHNFGGKDSVYLTLRTTMGDRSDYKAANKYSKTLDSTTMKVPCSLYVAHGFVGDTTFYHSLQITATIMDTVNDTTVTASYNITYDLIGRGN